MYWNANTHASFINKAAYGFKQETKSFIQIIQMTFLTPPEGGIK